MSANMKSRTEWTEINERYLAARVEALTACGLARERLSVDPGIGFGKTVAGPAESDAQATDLARSDREASKLERHDPPPALLLLAERLGLSTFDCDILALCAAAEPER